MIELFAVFVSGWLLVVGYPTVNDCLDAVARIQKEDGVVSVTCVEKEVN